MDDITGLVADPTRALRAYYGWWDASLDSGLRVQKYEIFAFAALGPDIWPVRVEVETGRGVLVGSPGDADREALLAVTPPGTWQALEGMDERVRDILQVGMAGGEGDAAQG